MIDLHTHTNYSDGTWNVKKLLEEAEKAKIEVLSITDHDTLKAYKDLENDEIKRIFNGKIISGIEFNTIYDGVTFHLLAYDFDVKKLEPWVIKNYEHKKPDLNKEFDYMIKSCKKNNIIIDDIKYNISDGWPIDVIYPEIKKHLENKKFFNEEEWNNIDIFYNSCVTNKNFPVFVDFSIHYPTADIVAEKVKEAGGKLFLAHLYRYNLNNPIYFLNLLKNKKIIDGVEVYHSSYTEEQIKKLEDYCKENKLLLSGGTDCHGEKKKDRKIGIGYGNMNVKKSILEQWKIM